MDIPSCLALCFLAAETELKEEGVAICRPFVDGGLSDLVTALIRDKFVCEGHGDPGVHAIFRAFQAESNTFDVLSTTVGDVSDVLGDGHRASRIRIY